MRIDESEFPPTKLTPCAPSLAPDPYEKQRPQVIQALLSCATNSRSWFCIFNASIRRFIIHWLKRSAARHIRIADGRIEFAARMEKLKKAETALAKARALMEESWK